MGMMKRYLEDIASAVDTGDRKEVEKLLGSWSAEDKVNILLEAMQLNAILKPAISYPRFRPVSYHWKLTLETNSGRRDLTTYAGNLLEVVERITDTESAPIRAIVKAERLDA
jgi:hypothetical protein